METRRKVIAQLTVCRGCCCGAVQRGKPDVPVEWLKQEWKRRGLLKKFQLTISGCLGPCDVPNVVVVNSAANSQWIGGITELIQYQELVEWAAQSVEAGYLLELPGQFHAQLLDTWR